MQSTSVLFLFLSVLAVQSTDESEPGRPAASGPPATEARAVPERLRFARMDLPAADFGRMRAIIATLGSGRTRSIPRTMEAARRHLEQRRWKAAYRNFLDAARYGNKLAQMHAAELLLKGRATGSPALAEGLAWAALAGEHPDLAERSRRVIDLVWPRLDDEHRIAAQTRLVELASQFSDLALLEQATRDMQLDVTMARANSTGNPFMQSTYVKQTIRQAHRIMSRAGRVELGEFEVLEPDETGRREAGVDAADSEEPE